MKRITALVLVAIANFAMASTSFAQSNGVRATVPFDFTVGSKLVPAGTYTISSESPNTILIQNGDRHVAIFSSAYADGKQSTTGKLVFHKYGNAYFVASTWMPNSDHNHEFFTSASEIEVARNTPQQTYELAMSVKK